MFLISRKRDDSQKIIYLFYFNKKIKNLFIHHNNWIKLRLKVQKNQS